MDDFSISLHFVTTSRICCCSNNLLSIDNFLCCSALSVLVRINIYLRIIERRKHTLGDIFARLVKRKGRDTVAVMHLDTKWTYGELDEYSNRVGNFLLNKGYEAQTNVALFMENEPKYIAIWLGAAKVYICSLLMFFCCFLISLIF